MMKELLSRMNIAVNQSIYLKDPASSDLGMRILKNAISLIRSEGFEDLTFKKLASKIQTSEASIYRYFENKNKLLLYITAWYWGWLEYKLVFSTANIKSPEERLSAAIRDNSPTSPQTLGNDFEFRFIASAGETPTRLVGDRRRRRRRLPWSRLLKLEGPAKQNRN